MSREVVEHVEVPAARLWTASQGCGVPVVLCHGGPGLCDNLGPLADMIDDLALVHRYDQRGSGRSTSDGPFEVHSLIADLEALRQHWGHARWIVGGHSWGANLSLAYALAHPDRTLGVIYLSGSGLDRRYRSEVKQARAARLTETERAELARLQPQLPTGEPGILDRFLQLVWTTDFADRGIATRVLAEQPLYRCPRNEPVARALTGSFDALVADGLEQRLRGFDGPVLVVHGAHDVPARARPIAELAPQGRWVLLEGSAHVPWLEEPASVQVILRGFLSELTAVS